MASRSSSDAMAYAARALAPARPPPRADPRRESCSAVFGLLWLWPLRQVVRPPARDRYIGHMSTSEIRAARCDTNASSPTKDVCHCSTHSDAASRVHTGMMPIGLPWVYPVSGVYPGSLPTPVGHWYRTPSRAAAHSARSSAREGGCTWQRAPLSHSLYPLLGAVCVRVEHYSQFPYNVCNAHQPLDQTLHIAAIRRAWQAKGLAPCGAPVSNPRRPLVIITIMRDAMRERLPRDVRKNC